MTNIDLTLATKLDGSETHMLAILVDSWGDKLVITLNCEMKIEPADYFRPCAHCGNAVLDCNFEAGSDCCDRCTNGKNWSPEAAFLDKNGKRTRINADKAEEIMQTMDQCVHTHADTCTGACWISDICTKRDELIGMTEESLNNAVWPIQPRVIANCAYCKKDIPEGEYYVKIENVPYHEACNTKRKSAILDMALTQTLPEDTMRTLQTEGSHPGMTTVKSTTTVVVNPSLDFNERMEIALEAAEFAFWDVIARSYPEAVSGDYLMDNLSVVCRPNVEHWLNNNLPAKQSHSGQAIDGLKLHYLDTWHLCHTGGGCMVAVTDNVAIAGEYRYLAVTSDSVAVYVDDFKEGGFLQDPLFTWSFGDNPTVLMNYLNDYLGNECLFDQNKLFDDIITLAKSGKC